MKIALVLQACLLVFLAAVAHADEPFTPAEKVQVDATASSLVDQCNTQMAAIAKQKADQGAPQALQDAMRPAEYCGCIGTQVRTALTPQLLREGSQQQGEQVVKTAATTCAARMLRAGFPAYCTKMVADLSRQPQALPSTPAQQAAACSCIQARVDRITGDNFQATVMASMRDYERYRRDPSAPFVASEGSIAGAMVGCFEDNGLSRPRAPAASAAAKGGR